MSVPKLAVHSDVIIAYVLHQGNTVPALRIALMKFFCYTTVFDAIEVFSLTQNENERRIIESAMSAMKILGLNAKNAKRYGDLLLNSAQTSSFSLLTAGVCLESKLPLLTDHPEEFRSVTGLKILRPSMILEHASAADIISRAKSIS